MGRTVLTFKLIFAKLGEIIDAYKGMNPLNFGSNPADTRMWISPETQIQILDSFLVDASNVEVVRCTRCLQSSFITF